MERDHASQGDGPDWGVGNYERAAQLLLPAARVHVEAAGLRNGERFLDLGSGTGSAALLVAAAGTQVIAVDPSERLLAVAQRAAAERNLKLTCRLGEAAHVPVPDSSVDCVLSDFGLIFAPDPDAAMAEMARVLTPRGRIAFTVWLPGGAAGALSAVAQDLVRAALGAGSPPPVLAWDDTSAVARLFSEHAMDLVVHARDQLTFTAAPPAAYLETELTNHPLASMALEVLRARGD